jgi:dihydrofolate reductase
MKASVYIATSLDGFIAREDGSVDWLPTGESASGEDYGYHKFMDSVDALVMGRNTFELVLSFGGDWPYGEKPVIVLTSRPLEIPDSIPDSVSVMSGPPAEIVQQLGERGYQHLYIDGGATLQGFIREGLIQTLIITTIPVLIGSGMPLFGTIPHDIHLRHMETRQFDNGLVQSKYEILSGRD